MKALCDRLLLIETVSSLIDVLCSCLSDWFDTQLVSPEKYLPKYHSAIITQTKIGWFHIFTGHISQEWERLQNQGKSSSRYKGLPWSTHIVEVCLQYSIKLWELRNAEVHGATIHIGSVLKFLSLRQLFFIFKAFSIKLALRTPGYLMVLGPCSKRLILKQWKTGLFPEDRLYSIAFVRPKIKLSQILINCITGFLI